MSLSQKYVFFFAVFFFCIYSFIPCQAQQKDSLPKKYHVLVLPVLARSIETNWSFGGVGSLTFHIGKKDSLVRTSNLQGLILYSLRQQFITAFNGTIYFPGEKYILSHQFSFSLFPDKFWGLGKIAPDSNEESYKFKQFYIYLHGQRSFGSHLYLGLLYEYQRLLTVEYKAGGLFDKENVPGRNGYHVSGLGLSITYDTRNNAFSPDKGAFLQGYFNHFDPVLGSDFSYTNYVIDLRKFIRTYKKQVLAMQAYVFLNSGVVPLRSLASFGGANSMRGYYAGRYRDRNQVVLQTEYRAPLFWRLGAVVFGGIGNVGKRSNDLNFTELKYSYGGGLRVALNKTEKLNLRLDYGIGKGPKSEGFYFQLGEAF
jgi:outer membrane protein assembly factor BamA